MTSSSIVSTAMQSYKKIKFCEFFEKWGPNLKGLAIMIDKSTQVSKECKIVIYNVNDIHHLKK